MRVTRVQVVMVQHEWRKWLVAQGKVVVEVDDVTPCSDAEARAAAWLGAERQEAWRKLTGRISGGLRRAYGGVVRIG